MMMSGLLLWHRAAEDRLVLLVHHWPRPVAAVQHTHMSGACAELGTTTSPATPRVSARLLCSPASVARRRNLYLSGTGESHMHTNSMLSE